MICKTFGFCRSIMEKKTISDTCSKHDNAKYNQSSKRWIRCAKNILYGFCIKFYAAHIGVSTLTVYQLFDESGLLLLIETDYDDLHGMSIEHLNGFFDDYLKGVPVLFITVPLASHLPLIILFNHKWRCQIR